MNLKTTTSIKWIGNEARGAGGYFYEEDPFYYWVVPALNIDSVGKWEVMIYQITEKFEALKIFSKVYQTKGEAMVRAHIEWEARR
jgi:hypothetical protein